MLPEDHGSPISCATGLQRLYLRKEKLLLACLDMTCFPPLTNYCRDLQALPRSTHPLLEADNHTLDSISNRLVFLAAVRSPFCLRAIGTEHPSIYAVRRCQRPFKREESLAYTSLVHSTTGYKCFVALQHQAK